jgi:hypothetical protein
MTVAILQVLVFLSCGGNQTEKKEEMKDTGAMSAQAPQLEDNDISYVLPSPVQVADIFKKAGLRYYSGITNNTSNIAAYKTGSSLSKALNLGVYSADLSYCVLNKQSQESKNYFKVCKDLAADLGLAKAFEIKDAAQRLDRNINSQDSLAVILADIQMETDNLLSESNQEYISVVSFTGAWIESMYIGIQVHSKEKNMAIASELVQQMSIAENVIKALKAYASRDAGINDLVQKMASLNEIYNGFKSVQQIKATDPDVIDASKLSISITELYSFSKRLEEIRNSITKA